jgi:hypothetical protein
MAIVPGRGSGVQEGFQAMEQRRFQDDVEIELGGTTAVVRHIAPVSEALFFLQWSNKNEILMKS